MAQATIEYFCDNCWSVFSDGAAEVCPGEGNEPGCGADRGKSWTRLPHEIAPGLVATRRLGRGGFAAVFLCQAGHTPVAVKVARRDGPRGESGKPKKVEAFEYEIKIATRVSDASAFASVHSSAFKPEPFLALEYLDAQPDAHGAGWQPLEELVHPDGRSDHAHALPLEDALDVAVALLRGLVLIHRSGIAHRDLHPGNLFVRRGVDGALALKVIDYGLAADLNAATMLAAPRIGAAGRNHYASPEQMAGAPADPADDIYTVGVVLWEALAGARPSSPEAHRPAAIPEAIFAPLKQSLATARQARPSASELLLRFEPLQREHAARRLTRAARELAQRVKPLSQALVALERLGDGVEAAQADPSAYHKDFERRRADVRDRIAMAHADLNGGTAPPAPRRRSPLIAASAAVAVAAAGVVIGLVAAPEAAPPAAATTTTHVPAPAPPEVIAAPAPSEAPVDPVAIAERALAALIEGGEDDVLADDATLSVWGRESASGREAIRRWRGISGLFPDARAKAREFIELEDGWLFGEIVFRGTFAPAMIPGLDGLPPVPDRREATLSDKVDGRVLIDGVVLIQIRGERAQRIELFLDGAAALAQLGFMRWEAKQARWPLRDRGSPAPLSRFECPSSTVDPVANVRAFFAAYEKSPKEAVEHHYAQEFVLTNVWLGESWGRDEYMKDSQARSWSLDRFIASGACLVLTLEVGDAGKKGAAPQPFTQLALWSFSEPGLVRSRDVYWSPIAETTLADEKVERFEPLFGRKHEIPP